MITWSNVVNLPAPELATVPLAAQTQILTFVSTFLSEDVWGGLIDTGRAYLAAHLATSGSRGGAGGPVTSESVGQVSRAYAASIAAGAAQLGSTAYGLTYEYLTSTLPAARFTWSA